jgi:cytochrome c-type biogenesis protein CcmH/NrfG
MIRQASKRDLRRFAAGLIAVVLCAAALPAMAAVEDDLPPELARLHNTGKYQELATALQASVEAQPQSAVLRYWLGRSYYELRDYNHAESSLEQATKLAPNSSEYYDWLGKASGRKAQRANPFSAMSLARKTHRAFEAAVRLSPTNVEAQRDLISYLLNAPGFLGGGEDKALKQIQALSVVDAVDGMLARAEYFVTRKKLDLAADEYQKILKTDVRRIGVQMEIAEFYRDRGDAAHMQAAVDAAAKLGPDDARLEYYRGVALVLAQQDPAAAEQHLRAYLQTVPDGSQVPSHSSAHHWLGTLYEAQGQRDQAAAEYQAVLSLDPRDDGARKALERVRRR